MLVFLPRSQFQSKEKNSKYRTGIDYNEQIYKSIKEEKFQSTKQVAINYNEENKSIKVQKRCVFLMATQVKFSLG